MISYSAGEDMMFSCTLGASAGLADLRVTWPRLKGCSSTTPTEKW